MTAAEDRGAARARGNRPLATGLVALLALGGFNLARVLTGGFAAGPPPLPPVSAARALPAVPGVAGAGALPPLAYGQARTASGADAAPPTFAPAMPYARPTRVTVSRVGIDAELIEVGTFPNGAIGVPPLSDARKAAWFDRAPAPGQNGAAVIDAHVDSRAIPDHRAAFYSLGAVRPGDRVEVARDDGLVAEFTVDSVELVRKRDFPTQKVFGPLPYAGLRLITCGGEFVQGQGYLGNVVVYAHLSGRHRAAS